MSSARFPDISELVQRAMQAAPVGAALPDAADASPGDVQELVDLYFLCDDAAERDVVFAQLERAPPAATEAFFIAMMGHDFDSAMRVAAAAALAQRGHAPAAALLRSWLRQGGDSAPFGQVLAALVGLADPALYGMLREIWHDASRHRGERLAAMRGLEMLAPESAVQDMVRLFDALQDARHIPEEQLDAAIHICARQPTPQAQESLTRLLARIEASDPNDFAERPAPLAPGTADEAGGEVDMGHEVKGAMCAMARAGLNVMRSALAPA